MIHPATAPSIPPERRFFKRPAKRTIIYAVATQAGLLLVAVFVVVLEPLFRSDPEFTARKTIYLPQKVLEQSVALSEFQQAASKPMLMDRLTTSALMPTNLPAMPAVPRSDATPLDPSEMLAGDAQSLLAQSGLTGAMGGLKSRASVAAFFGVSDSAEKIVVIVNTSASVVRKARSRGVTIEKMQDELISLVRGLDSGTQFGIVQFSHGARSFADFLAPATTPNKEAVTKWVPDNLKGNPVAGAGDAYFGHEAGMAAALALQPDVIFLLTDGQLNRRTVEGGRVAYPEIPYNDFLRSVRAMQRRSGTDVRIHVIGFEMEKADAENMRKFAGAFKGQIREF
jgi:hypothetical protein